MSIESILSNLGEFGKQASDLQISEAVTENCKSLAVTIAKKELITEATLAIDSIDEFKYPPLKSRLLSNMTDDRHCQVSSDAGTLTIFDESVAGSIADLIAGQHAAWGPNTAGTPHDKRLFCWTYGIYKPAREAGLVHPKKGKDRFADYPSYESIIDIRLDYWGDKAPYWIFLEDGNQGQGAYPTFSGTGFVSKVRSHAGRILRMAKVTALEEILSQLDGAVEEQMDKPEIRLPIYIGRVTVGRMPEGLVEVEMRGSKSGPWWMLIVGGQYKGKIQSGQPLPGDFGTFNP